MSKTRLAEIREHVRVHGSIPQKDTEWVLAELERYKADYAKAHREGWDDREARLKEEQKQDMERVVQAELQADTAEAREAVAVEQRRVARAQVEKLKLQLDGLQSQLDRIRRWFKISDGELARIEAVLAEEDARSLAEVREERRERQGGQ
jgi:multidrug efflux pump subunit AcrA (membrane-fusion protein)